MAQFLRASLSGLCCAECPRSELRSDHDQLISPRIGSLHQSLIMSIRSPRRPSRRKSNLKKVEFCTLYGYILYPFRY